MTQQQYIDYFQAKAQKMGDNPGILARRFCLYQRDDMFLPDISKFGLDLSEMCFLLGHYDFNMGGNGSIGNKPLRYQASIMLVKSAELNDFDSELQIMSEAEELAKHLYSACYKDKCNDSFGYWFGKTMMSDTPWSVEKIKLSHDNTVGVEIRFQFYLNNVLTATNQPNPFL